MRKELQESFKLVKSLYKNDYGKPFEMTEGQCEIFNCIFHRKYPRNQVETYTQYGKSEVVAMALLTCASTFPERYPLLAPDGKRANLLISKIIKHIFDNPFTESRFAIGKEESKERILRERSKNKLTFNTGKGIGEIFIVSAQAKYANSDAGNALMGYGAQNLIEEEAALIPNVVHAKAMRMLQGHKKNFLVKIGNTISRNHFYRTHEDPKYKVININVYQGLKEGRITQGQIDEMRIEMDKITFKQMYDCKFPDENEIDNEGYIPLLTEAELENAQVDSLHHFGNSKLGIDVAGGGANYSVIIRRSEQFAEVHLRNQNDDTTVLADDALTLKNELNRPINLSAVSIVRPIIEIDVDSVGIGRGVYDILRGQTDRVYAVIGGGMADDKVRFADKRAENYWRLREWVLTGGKLLKHKQWKELLDIKWKRQSDKKIRIISKEELRKKGIISPDVADALMNTFMNKDITMSQMQAQSLMDEDPISKDVI